MWASQSAFSRNVDLPGLIPVAVAISVPRSLRLSVLPATPAWHGGALARTTNPVDQLRKICQTLPEVTERPSHGEPSFFGRGQKQFVMLDNHHHGGDS